MNSISENKLSKNLAAIMAELKEYNTMTKTDIFNEAINSRLKDTLYKYNNNIDQLSDFLVKQEGMRVLKTITKIQKADDKKIIYENMKEMIND